MQIEGGCGFFFSLGAEPVVPGGNQMGQNLPKLGKCSSNGENPLFHGENPPKIGKIPFSLAQILLKWGKSLQNGANPLFPGANPPIMGQILLK